MFNEIFVCICKFINELPLATYNLQYVNIINNLMIPRKDIFK